MSGGAKLGRPTGRVRRGATRRGLLAAGAAVLPSLALAQQQAPRRPPQPAPEPATPPPIVFVHGNGDSSALWINNIWRFEANGYRRNFLHAIDFRYPSARREDDKLQPNRSSTEDQLKELAAFVAEVRKETRRRKVALIASSRGGNAVRNYLKNGGGADSVSHAILCGTPNKGIVAVETILPGSEFNATSAFLKGLNSGEDDRIAGVELMTIRSDKLDKFAQPDGRFVGAPGKPTGVGPDTMELRGAKNVVLEGLDHREVAFHKLAFAQQYEFIAGKQPNTLFIAQEPNPILNGRVTGLDGVYTNLPVAGAEVEIYEVDAKTGERRGGTPANRKATGADGWWGPFTARADAFYEFVLRVAGQPVTHTYRSPFLRSTEVVHLRPGVFEKGEAEAGAAVVMTRPRGYFGHGRDKFTLDCKVPPGINDGVPGISVGRLTFDPGARTVVAVLNNETIPARTWPAMDNHIVYAEFLN